MLVGGKPLLRENWKTPLWIHLRIPLWSISTCLWEYILCIVRGDYLFEGETRTHACENELFSLGRISSILPLDMGIILPLDVELIPLHCKWEYLWRREWSGSWISWTRRRSPHWVNSVIIWLSLFSYLLLFFISTVILVECINLWIMRLKHIKRF
jgi:hypothetical protein